MILSGSLLLFCYRTSHGNEYECELCKKCFGYSVNVLKHKWLVHSSKSQFNSANSLIEAPDKIMAKRVRLFLKKYKWIEIYVCHLLETSSREI